MSEALDQLVALSRTLGDPGYEYAILGEGNTSATAEDGTFWVKASGAQLLRADRDSFVRVRSAPVLAALDGPALSDEETKQLLKQAIVSGQRQPSIETFLHALCLQIEGVRFVGHAHPTIAVGLLSSRQSRELFSDSLFPDQIVVLGPAFAYVPYTDPGLPLAATVKRTISEFLATHQRSPKVILMENHGVITLGATPQEVLNAMQMLVKTCHIIATTLLAGGPRPLTPQQVQRIDQRPDELARRRDLDLPK